MNILELVNNLLAEVAEHGPDVEVIVDVELGGSWVTQRPVTQVEGVTYAEGNTDVYLVCSL